ncbi:MULTISPECIES: SLATT domain-containing protein [unclassified Lentimonas]|uniref:SLATT domain-containing protein n=1 Tax=unclassified Lentimonas TaxID=2630993 RepID=UPI001325B9E4|nr:MULTISPECIES: SLATT domain-containing protein [unclassified Lentimonas]CAA6689986.1 Unannotated [Lentimonas sp. CC10]CAA6691062.1 Unannotated [Lentimonas sp. CC19]CAA7069324.1 Unannotated [Lentimonas sp. CC11]
MNEGSDILEGQLRECYGRVVYSHKTHEKCADILLRHLKTINWLQIILSAIASTGFITAIWGEEKIGAIIGSIVSISLLILNAYTKDYDHGELAQKHRQAAADLWLIREKYLSLLTDLRMEAKSLEAIGKERDLLLQELHAVYSGAPSTNNKAYRAAQHALQNLEDMTFSDDEVDAFLPAELKRKK